MPRKRTGTIQPIPGSRPVRYRARIRLADGSRPWLKVPEGKSEDAARQYAGRMQELEDAGGKMLARRLAKAGKVATKDGAIETVAAYSERWLAERDAAGLSSTKESRGRLKKHVLPIFGAIAITDVQRDDLKKFVERLDDHVRASAEREREGKKGKGDYGWKTATHIWSDVAKMFKDSCSSKRRALCVRNDNPAQGVVGPDRGGRKAPQYIWPSEFLAFVACTKIPIEWRRLLALSTLLYCRPEELEPLEWGDVDLEHRTVHIHRAVDRVRNKGRVKETKTGIARRVPIEPRLLPLLQAMRAEGAGRRLVKMPPAYALSRTLRKHLRLAGVTREDLFKTDATRQQITWYHATRSTGITWCAVRGDDPVKLMRRAGHTDFATTMLYIREAENLRHGFGEVFPALPAELLVVRSTERSTGMAIDFVNPGNPSNDLVGATGFESLDLREDQEKGPAIGDAEDGDANVAGGANYVTARDVDQRTVHENRASLLAAIDAATSRGDVDAASSLLARLLSLGAPGQGDTVLS